MCRFLQVRWLDASDEAELSRLYANHRQFVETAVRRIDLGLCSPYVGGKYQGERLRRGVDGWPGL